MEMTKRNMPETLYRASRCCRVLGNPTAYLVLRYMDEKRVSPSELSRRLEIHLTTISMTLRHLRQMDLVRYETRGREKEYWVKDIQVLRFLSALEDWVQSVRDMQS